MSRLCATVFEPTTERALETLALAGPHADLLEIRLDSLADPDPDRLVAAATRPVVATCRAARDGGRFRGSEQERLALLEAAREAGAEWIDLELRCAAELPRFSGALSILSHHDFEGIPEDLPGLVKEMRGHAPDLIKVAVTPHGPEDVLAALSLLNSDSHDLAVLTMGEAGLPGRLLAAALGSQILYGAAGYGDAAAPGQPTLWRMIGDYGLDRDLVAAPTLLLLGGSLGHSVSPRMMNRTFRERGLAALYVPWALTDPGPVLRALEAIGARGAAATIPLKEIILDHLDALDPVAARIGAVNTVVVGPRGLTGANTDQVGALDPIRRRLLDLARREALVLGAGGAARAIAVGLFDEGARVTIVSRTARRAEVLAAEVAGRAVSLDDVDPDRTELIVNATPVGQWPEVSGSPLPASFLRPTQVVMDAVVNPPETRLLREARAAGCETIEGIEMLARQGAEQVRLWLGETLSAESLEEEGRAALAGRFGSLALVGMRGAGKTSVGRILAERLGRTFTDLDDRIEERAGMRIPEIFQEEGEAEFRRIELSALVEALEEPTPIVLAVGGGAVEAPEARRRLRKSGATVVWIDAPREVLAERVRDSGRPSLTGAPVEDEVGLLSDRRRPQYNSVSGMRVQACGSTPEGTADRVLSALEF